MLDDMLFVLWWEMEPLRATSVSVCGQMGAHTKALFEAAVVATQMKWFAADGTIGEVFGELLVALLVHDMRTIGRLDHLLALEASGERLAADGARGASEVGVAVGRWTGHVDHLVVAVVWR